MSTTDRIEELRRKFDENPRRYFAPLANEYRKAGDLLQAIGLCREHLPKQPGHMSGYVVFGQALYESGELTEAQTVFEQALALDPENLIALRHLGDIMRDVGDEPAARRWYSRVLDADPGNREIGAQLAALSAVRTPDSSPAFQRFDALARPSETPVVPVEAIGQAAFPTPDAVMRTVDMDAWNVRPAHHSPIDLEAVADVADAAPSQESVQFIGEVPYLGIPTSPSSVPAIESLVDEDPFGFPEASAPAEPQETTATSEQFEEGLVAPEWTEASNVVSIFATPRSSNPAIPTPRSVEVSAEAISAFGREVGDPVEEVRAASPTPDAFLDTMAASVEAELAAEPIAESIAEPLPEVAPVSGEAFLAFASEAAVIAREQPDSLEDVFAVAEALGAQTTSDAALPATSETHETLVSALFSETPVATPASDDTNTVESLFEQLDAEAASAPADEQPQWSNAPFAAADAGSAEPEAATGQDIGIGAGQDVAARFAQPTLEYEEAVSYEETVSIESLRYDEPLVEQSASLFDDEAGEAPLVTPSSSPAFVTETMAELFISQGFIDRGVEVYDELVQRHPADEALAARRDQVRAFLTPIAGDATPIDAIEPEQADAPSAMSERSDPWADAAPAFLSQAEAPSLYKTPAYPTPAYPTPAYPTPAFPEPAHPTPASTAAHGPPTSVAATVSPIEPLFGVPSMADAFSRSSGYATPSAPASGHGLTPAAATPYAQPAADPDAPSPRLAREWFAALASRRVTRRTPTLPIAAPSHAPDGLAILFGGDASTQDDVAARALADAFAPIPESELASGEALDFSFSSSPRSTPAVPRAAVATPAAPQQPVSPPRRQTPESATDASSGNAGFAFDKFFPDPAARRDVTAEPTQAPSSATVTDDLAQFSSWLKGLGNA